MNSLLELVRRIQGALGAQSATLQRDGEEIWDALEQDTRPADVAPLVELLDAAREIDRLGDALAEWGVDISRRRPTTWSTRSLLMSLVAWSGLIPPEVACPPGVHEVEYPLAAVRCPVVVGGSSCPLKMKS